MKIFPRFERSKLVPRILLGLLIGVVTTLLGYKLFIHSEPFEFGTHFVTTDPRVLAVTGRSNETELRIMRGFRFSFGDRSGSAAMTITSSATNGVFDVELSLEKKAGSWAVSEAHLYPRQGPAVTIVGATSCRQPCS
jgi:hypothetical protein